MATSPPPAKTRDAAESKASPRSERGPDQQTNDGVEDDENSSRAMKQQQQQQQSRKQGRKQRRDYSSGSAARSPSASASASDSESNSISAADEYERPAKKARRSPGDQSVDGKHRKKRPKHTSDSGSDADPDSKSDRAPAKPSVEDEEDGEYRDNRDGSATAPPLPVGEEPPPLPDEPPPAGAGTAGAAAEEDDGWEALWDDGNQSFYFYNRHTGVTQWENPRVPQDEGEDGGKGTGNGNANDERGPPPAQARVHGGYNPAIHGDYDPNADYAVAARADEDARVAAAASAASATSSGRAEYATSGTFNRFTGKWQRAEDNAERHNDENKSKRQMNAFFDVDAAANSHGGRSLKAERQNKKLSKAELKAFKEKRRERKEEKRRAWLRD